MLRPVATVKSNPHSPGDAMVNVLVAHEASQSCIRLHLETANARKTFSFHRTAEFFFDCHPLYSTFGWCGGLNKNVP